MSLAQVWGEIGEHNRRIVERETWGHLDAKPRVVYAGYILFTDGCFNDTTIIDYELKDGEGNELQSSPWFYRDIHDWALDQTQERNRPGGIWRFDGTYTLRKNGKAKFSGKVRPMRLSYRFGGKR